MAALVMTLGGASPSAWGQVTRPETPLKVVVQAWNAGGAAQDAPLTIGVVIELIHRLQRSPALIVREPQRALVSRNGLAIQRAKDADVAYIVWVTAQETGPNVRVRWELERVSESKSIAAGAAPGGSALAAVPSRIASLLLHKFGVADLPPAAHAAADNHAYGEFLRRIGHTAADSEDRAALEARIGALEKLLPRLAAYPPAVTALGSDHLDLAGIVSGPTPYYARATAALEHAFQLDPTYPPARAKLASLYAKVGKSERAVELLSTGLTTHPHYVPFHETLGYVLRYAGLMERSIDSYRQGQKLDASLDNLVSTQDQITKSLIYLGNYEAALASHRRMRSFLRRANRLPDEKQWFYEGVIHLYRGDAAAAVEAFRAGARVVPNSIWTTFGRGYEAIAVGDWARVDAVLRELERQEIVDGERHYRLVHFATFASRPDRALHHLDVSIKGGFFNAPYIARDPWLEPLRRAPRFTQILSAAHARYDAVRRTLETAARR